jgi:hypothetical protein
MPIKRGALASTTGLDYNHGGEEIARKGTHLKGIFAP